MMNLRQRAAGRSARSVALTIILALIAVLTFSFIGVTSALQTAANRMLNVDLAVAPESTSWRNSEGRTLSSEKVADIRLLAPVAASTGILEQDAGNDILAIGFDPGGLQNVGVTLRFAAGGPPKTTAEVVLDSRLSQRLHTGIGEKLILLGRAWRVSGLVEGTSGAFVLLPTLQQATHQEGQVSRVLVRLKDSRNSQLQVRGAMIYSPRQFRSSMTLSGFPALNGLFTVAGILFGLSLLFIVFWPRPLWAR